VSYIAVDLKVIEVHAPGVARSSGVSEDRVLAGLVRLWHRCWSTKVAVVSPIALAAAFGGDRIQEVAAAMTDAGLLEALPDGWRVRGADRYFRLDEARSRGGKAAAKNLIPGARHVRTLSAAAESQPRASREPAEKGSRLLSALTPSTEHRAPNTSKRTARTEPPTPAPHPHFKDTVEGITAQFAETVGAKYPFVARDAAIVARLLKAPMEPAAITDAWRRALTHTGWPAVRTLAQLEQHLAHFVGAAPPAARDAKAPALPSQQFTPSLTEGF